MCFPTKMENAKLDNSNIVGCGSVQDFVDYLYDTKPFESETATVVGIHQINGP